ncbi:MULTISPECIES: nuclear transport factor 2 family protein [Kordiimonas]|uniref:nuclear transport factor 2 family protein n=1 Tax=Kordiimonas TaxID=288021 RepID=UPI00258082C2|nr:nuclear transport factor 2 family protein [Kordiimonas sp. UBA4487]
MKTAFFGIVAAILVSFSASAEGLIEKAEKFVDALEQEDLKTVEPMMAEAFIFEDPTWGAAHEGKANVLKIYQNYTGGARNLQKIKTQAYESAGTVVFVYVYYAEMNLAGRGKEPRYHPVMGYGGRIIQFDKAGLVKRHIDFADYASVAKIAASLKE